MFVSGILMDLLSNKLTDPVQEERRADELTDLLTRLGPSFIKAGQSLSIRTDLLRPAYYRALSRLQDKVPSYPTAEARAIIREDLGAEVEALFPSGLEPGARTVAAASLGQVYRARTADGGEVAVKVQRPRILATAALDMHLIRGLGPALRRLFGLQTDVVALVDEWAAGFIDELDYAAEARNAALFSESILRTPLGGLVFAPEVVPACSGRRVLTTRWVEGVKLERAPRADVPALCALTMNAYLTMMLETGVLHCDQHPGNLFVTPEGRLCILDWGLVTRLDGNIQAAFIEHIAHLTSRDYAAIPRCCTAPRHVGKLVDGGVLWLQRPGAAGLHHRGQRAGGGGGGRGAGAGLGVLQAGRRRCAHSLPYCSELADSYPE